MWQILVGIIFFYIFKKNCYNFMTHLQQTKEENEYNNTDN